MYANTDDLKGRLKSFFDQLYADDEAAGGVNLEDAAEDIEAAEAEVDGAAGVRYTVPVTATAALPLLKNWTLTITEELAWRRSAQGASPENVKDRVKEVRRQLERLAKKEVVLQGAGESSASSGGASIVSGDAPVFTREKMSGF
jgi:phage gp36-like protein